MPVVGNTLICPNCNKPKQINQVTCEYCQSDLGAPNVNIVSTEDELNALQKRYEAALEFGNKNKTNDFINKFKEYFDNNVEVIINLDLAELSKILLITGAYKNYYRNIDDGDRLIASPANDKMRNIIDSVLSDKYGRDIVYATFTLNNNGLISYGKCSITIDEMAIKLRASTLEENSYDFVKTHNLGPNNPNLPLGYRSRWDNKRDLAVAKLYKKITSDDEKSFCDLVLNSNGDRDRDQFLEVHIYKEVSILAIKHIRVPLPRNRTDRFRLEAIEEKFHKKVVRI